MTKQEFIHKLQKDLAVLEESEIKDIVEEYEQHIDMKMKDGMSEENAIQDFGDMDELIGGILEAYHVKADYAGNKNSQDFDKVKETGKYMTGAAISGIGKGTKKIVTSLKNGIRAPFEQMKKEFANRPKKEKKESFLGRIVEFVKQFFVNCLILIRWMWRTCIALCVFFLRATWFGFCLVGALAGIFWEIVGVFGIGFCVVMLIQGYPLVGIMIALIGAVLANSVICFLFFAECGRMIRKIKESGPRQGKKNEKTDDTNVQEEEFFDCKKMEVASNE